jgi:predicted RNA-binding protein YlxR (DUF448 family)
VVVVADEVRHVEPDLRGQRPGRGAYLHPDPHCLDLAERRRAFPRAFRLGGPLVSTTVREYLEPPKEQLFIRGPGKQVD